ncbi:hypothetical protein BpHYR1_005684 [Brachionus plicatilis]|uniref:Uncharacterized protein n=1 Tax=Brachionus plicatilis TaxID=10195 RepID=A0A3M7QU50_BRAPC|nr:hypothetical protein BpHYR1_005684 [Brachionus plicatilis]
MINLQILYFGQQIFKLINKKNYLLSLYLSKNKKKSIAAAQEKEFEFISSFDLICLDHNISVLLPNRFQI